MREENGLGGKTAGACEREGGIAAVGGAGGC